MQSTATHAIVLGGSLAGLCAAGVLSRYFDKVTVVERDRYAQGPTARAGVPQSRHPHVLMPAGQQAIERIFPGFSRRLLAKGALGIDFFMEMAVLDDSGWVPRRPSGLVWLMASRHLTDSVLRELAGERDAIFIREHTEATGVVVALCGAAQRVAGVQVRNRATGRTEMLSADLVVDASGRSSKVLDWLAEMGFAGPEQTVVDPVAGSSTRWFQAPAGHRLPGGQWWKGSIIRLGLSEGNKQAMLFPVEDNRWIASITGFGGDYPPVDEPSFTAAFSTLASPLIAQAVAHCEPISPVYTNRSAANRFRRYDHWNIRLDGLVVLGDAVCAFNPAHGQGMSSAAVCATILDEQLHAHGPLCPDLARYFFQAQARWLLRPWTLAIALDLRLPTTVGKRPAGGKFVGWYMKQAGLAANEENQVGAQLHRTFTLLDPFTALFSPAIAARVLRYTMRHRWAGRSGARSPSVMPPLHAPSRHDRSPGRGAGHQNAPRVGSAGPFTP